MRLKEIKTIEYTTNQTKVYDLNVDEDHSYTVEGIVVHNSVCSTRIQTGFGMPQFSAIVECVRCGKPIIADGGIRSPGDANKALGAGAAIVMMGGMLAGTAETPGEIIVEDNKPYKIFRGMASKEVNDDYFGGLKGWKTAEGVSTKVSLKGSVNEVLHELEGGLRSGLTYCGAFNLKEFTQRIEFVEITHAGYMEGLPHIK